MKIFIHRNGQVYGPYSKNSIHSFLKDGHLYSNDWAWCQGWVTWGKLWKLEGNNQDKTSGHSLSSKEIEFVDKIKGLVSKERDQFAHDLTFGNENNGIICELLQECKIDHQYGTPELPDWISDALGFLLSLLERVSPENELKVHQSIRPTQVRKLCISHARDTISNLKWIKVFPNLELLKLSNLNELKNIEDIVACSKLEELRIDSCEQLSSIESVLPLSKSKYLQRLALTGLDFIESAHFLSQLDQLKELQLCSVGLTNLLGIEKLKKLEKLNLEKCSSLTQVDLIGNFLELKELDLGMCEQIDNLDCLEKLLELEKLNLNGCFLVEKLPSFEGMRNLQIVNLYGASIPLEACKSLEEKESIRQLTLPNGIRIERFTNEDEPSGTLPRIDFYLGGWGLEAHEGSLTEEQYEYWKDKNESELIEHCAGWNEEDEEIPENARLRSWYEMSDISSNNGCQDGTLEVTEYREWKNGWQKKYQTFAIEGGDSRDDDVKVNWIEPDREAPTSPSFQGHSSEKGMYCNDTIEGKTFDPSKLELNSEPVFGGAQGDAINEIYYDGQELEFCPEADNKGYYFDIIPPPAK